MRLLDHHRRMARNSLWSNDRLYRAVLSLGAGEFEAARTSFFPSIKATLNHLLDVDLFYLDFLEEKRSQTVFVEFEDARRLASAQAEFDRKLVEFCDGLAEDDLERCVATDRGQQGIIPERIGDLLTHLFVHDIHHRGQVHAMLSGSSVAPPQLDEFFLDYDLQFRKDEVERLAI